MISTADSEDISQVTSQPEKSCTSSDAPNSPENNQVSTRHNNRELTLNMLVKEMVFCIALALTTYGALHNSPPKVSKHPQPARFFSIDSPVTDWFTGQLSYVFSSINFDDVSFVMYYAPWDAESQFVRGEFEKAATVLSDRVHFSAINCWNPGSECRLQHNKIPSWPILIAYTSNSIGIIYKGPKDAHSMVNFLEMIMHPLKRVSSTEDLVHLLSYCDAVAVGYTPLSETSKFYNTWYQVSLKSREFDSIGEICFASVTSEDLAVDLGVDIVPNVRLMLWNDTKEYISEDSDPHVWNETALMHWVLENFSQPVARIIPMWKKAFSFERYADGNPILILFTPLNPLYEQLPAYAMLREVAMEYYNCNNNESAQWTSELAKLQQVQRLLYQQKDHVNFCQKHTFKKPTNKHRKEVESRNNKYTWYNSTQKSQKSGVFNFLAKRGIDVSKAAESTDENSLMSSLSWLQECGTKALPAERSFYDHYEKCLSFEEEFSQDRDEETGYESVETTMLPLEDDPLSSESLMQDNVKHFCKLVKFARELSAPVAPRAVEAERANFTDIRGVACANNFTLYMLAVDSVKNYHFAESLGIDVSSKKDMTAVVILDSKQESQYVLSEDYNAKTIRDFIYNFTNKYLKRSLRTHVSDAAHTHYFGSHRPVGEGKEKEDSAKGAAGAEGEESREGNLIGEEIDILDLTTKTFRQMVRTSGTAHIVAVCGGACGALTTRAVVEAARRLRGGGERARPARLDALRHDLPWHYTAHVYPTIFVFPADRSAEAESRAYPAGERVSSGGLVALALRSLGAPQHLRARLALCAQARGNLEKQTCLKDIKEHVTTLVGQHLKYWRRADEQFKWDVFRRLEHLHRVSFKLSLLHVTDLNHVQKQQPVFDAINLLSKNWPIDVSRNRVS